MDFSKFPWLVLHCWLLSLLLSKAHADASEASVKFLKAPKPFSHVNSATFLFLVLVDGNDTCSDCVISCKLDDGIASHCGTREVLYTGLQDGNHTFIVCWNGSLGVGCSSYNWIVDTVPPTAYITASSSFTSELNVSVNISFTEPCIGGGFRCSSVNACNLLVYGAGQVVPSSLVTLQPALKYSLIVSLSPMVQYGRVILVMGKNFCTDSAGNKFTRTANSIFYVHFDRRSVFVNLRSRVPEKLLQLDSETRTVQTTNNYDNLKVYFYFSEPVLNSSAEILNSMNISKGTLLPISSANHGNRRFGFMVANVSSIAIITISLDTNSIISIPGIPVSPIEPITFLFDSQRPAVRLSTTSSMRTNQHSIPISIKFLKPVFGFNSSFISISGGHLQRFYEVSRSIYTVEIQAADDGVISVNVPENVTGDVAGNKNLASNVLQRTACHIQVFALSRWLAVTLPVEYYEFARALQWSIPYFNLPWETGNVQPVTMSSSHPPSPHSYVSKFHHLENFGIEQPKERNFNRAPMVYGTPLTPMEYIIFFESETMKPEAEYMDSQHLNGWRDFYRSMFWLAAIGGSLILLHALLILILKFKKKKSETKSGYGALTFPRFEIFLVILALPSVCKASAALVTGETPSGLTVGVLLLGIVSFLLLFLLFFLSIGITFAKLLLYKEVHQEGQIFHWYQEIIRVTLGPGKRGQWTWKNAPNSVFLIIYGPLFEDLRGPPKYMLSQISGSNPHKHGDHIIDSDDETEDAEAPFIQKLFGILRIYYTLLESVKRVSLGILVGASYMDEWSSKSRTIVLLSITCFQLFFLVLKKPFIKKKVQLVEIISVACEVGIFTLCLVLLEKEFSVEEDTKIGIFMIILFLVGYFALMMNEWQALYRQTKQLDGAKSSFLTGLKIASFGFLQLVLPQKLIKNLESKFPSTEREEGGTGDAASSAERYRSSGTGSQSSGTTDKPWMKQLRELAKSSFSIQGRGAPNDPSTSSGYPKWSDFWSFKKSGSSSLNSPSESEPKPKGLDKDLEAIFAAK
ncbi:uncharacterized protein LOC123211359 isoform X2 [Mangifera indica]|uniref:uncharacterized protein LOC123211359 isoform X2 n=1 Tax=Mangifera indica TaxID=29780 RepID=UPI001CFBC74A|nr:uncharacterized protein LOC123211359 isoform X2 [Mangifera indica]